MKKTGKIVVSTYILISISMICGLKVNASAATISGNDFITAQLAEQQAVMNEETLSFSVDYPEILKCGEATTFTLTPTGGSGIFKYRLGNLMRADDGEMNYVIDPSRLRYQDENTFEFTFTASGRYQLDFYVMDMTTNLYVRKIIKLEINDPDYPSVETVADEVIAQCIAAGNETEYEKALWLHDWIINNMSYDNSLTYCGPEGALTRGKGTCESYHRGYAMLLERVGIETTRMTGNGHLWTGIKLNGKWYHVDATWDDPGYQDSSIDINHLYFGVTDEIIKQVHTEYQPNSVYVADSIDNNYFVKNGQLQTWADQYASEIQQHLKLNDDSFSICAKNTQWIEGYKTVVNRLIRQKFQEEITKEETVAEAMVEYGNDSFVFNIQYESNGWRIENGNYYYVENGKKITGWKSIEGEKYYFDANGIRQTGWIDYNSARYYLDSNGIMLQNRWINSVYYVKADGKMAVSEWVDGGKYYVDAEGKYVPGKTRVQSGWEKDNTGWWYLREDGTYPKNQWELISGTWYHFDGNGYMQTGWFREGTTWYYLESGGAMAYSKWIDNTYYVKSDGRMAVSEWVDNGKYYVDANGRYVPGKTKIQSGWKKNNIGWWYLRENETYPINQWEWINGSWYHFDTNGYMQTGWLRDGSTWYYLEPNGAMAYNKWISNIYYVKADGKMAVSEWVDNNRYYVDANGKYVSGKTR